MAGYTRQSLATIINGADITAPPINSEFNQLLAAFNANTGHAHDGSTGSAPKINLTTSITGYLPAAHGGVGGKNKFDATSAPSTSNDAGEGYAPGSMWENVSNGRMYICVGNTSNSAVWREMVTVVSSNQITPITTNSVDLGTPSIRFQDAYLSGGLSAAGNIAIGGTLTTTGTSSFTGLATFANLSATGTTTITSIDLNSGAIDNATIGSATPAAGTFTTLNANTSLVAATADINGGTIDGAALGATTPSTGSFTTLGASGTSTLATVDINGGNIDGTIIGASTAATGSFTTLSTSGQATLATADINGGSIDGATVGASSASTGAFTTLSSSGGITGNLTGNVTGNITGNVTGDVTGNVTGNLTGNVTAGSGTSTFTNLVVNGNLNMNAGTSATITNLTAPSADLDAATKKYVDDEISTLIGDAGTGLDTLGELADALNDDDAFSTTVTNSIATKLPKAGGTMTGAIAMSTNKITGAGDPTSAQDVSTKAYTDTQRDTRVAKTGDTMSGALAMGNNKITGLATPTAGTDVTNKTYVDGILGSATVAATSATNAATSETNAATSATNAATSETNAATSATNAASSYDNFDDRYLGAKSSAPTVDNDGDALITGALYFNSTTNIMNVYGSGGWQSAGSAVNGTSERQTYTATAGQTVFAATYDTGYIDVYLNGVKLLSGTDFTATNGTSITLASGASVNDVVDIVAYGTFVLADHYTKTASDARYVEVAGDTMTGNLDVGGTVTSDGLTVSGSSTSTFNSGAENVVATFTSTDTEAQINLVDTTGSAQIRSRNDLRFYTNGGSTRAMDIDSSGRVGIGTSSPTSGRILDADGQVRFQSSSSGRYFDFVNDSSASYLDVSHALNIRTNGASSLTTAMTIDSSGNLLKRNNGNIEVGGYGNGTDYGVILTPADGGGYYHMYNDAGGHLAFGRGNTLGSSESMRIDSSGRLLLGTTTEGNSGADDFTVSGSGNIGITIRSTSSNDSAIYFSDGTSGASEYQGYIAYAHADNTFRFGAQGAEKMRIDSSGNVGLNLASPSEQLSTLGNVNIGNNDSSNPLSYLRFGATQYGAADIRPTDEGGHKVGLSFYTDGTGDVTINPTERMRIDSSGNLTLNPNSSGATYLNLNTGATDDGHIIIQRNGSNKYQITSGTTNALQFYNYTAGGESMRIDSSGNLLVGKTTDAFGTAGVVMRQLGIINITRANGSVLNLNRTGSDGALAEFHKDGGTVGIIRGYGASELSIGANHINGSGLYLSSGNQTLPMKDGGLSDNTQDIGKSSIRWQDIYATNGTIQTSDFNEKQDIASLTATEMLVGKRISALFKTFRWKDSVAEKGDNARTHTGVIAQDVQAAFTAEGLDAGVYALFISSTWWEHDVEVPAVEAVAEVLDEDGNVTTEAVVAKDAYTRTDTYDTEAEAPEGATSKTRMGIRYPELLSFVAAYNEQRFASIEARLTALEA